MLSAAEARELESITRELELRSSDPLALAIEVCTPAQRKFVESLARQKAAEGGNQSGKSRTLAVDFLAQALGVHPTKRWHPPNPGAAWKGWYSTTTYQLFAEQGWHHFKSLLLYPGEEIPKRGERTRRILEIGWDKRAPERVKYLKLAREDGHIAEVYIKSFDQGRGEFQSAEVDYLALDEECPEEIYQEAQPRILRRGGQIGVGATPVEGVLWLEDLRARGEAGDPGVFHTRFATTDNPSLSKEALAELVREYKDYPHLARLRLEGYPVADEGRIYSDRVFHLPGRIVKPHDIGGWTLYRSIDHGVHTVAALWLAVAPGRKKITAYREYYGQDVEPVIGKGCLPHGDVTARATDGGNAARILAASLPDGGEEIYHKAWIDPATQGSGQETGKRLIDLWRGAHVRCEPAPDNRVEPGIERVKLLLGEKAPDGGPLFTVWEGCTNFLRERRLYSRQPKREKGDVGPLKPWKRYDHLMDDFRYLVAAGLEFVPYVQPPPAAGTLAREFWEERNPQPRQRL